MIPFLVALTLAAEPVHAGEFRSVDDVLARFDGEPGIGDVQRMVLETTKTDPSYVDKWLAASVNAAWLPEFTFTWDHDSRYNRDYDYIASTTPDGEPTSQIDQSAVDTADGLQLRAKWNLDKLVMSSERIRVISEAQDVVKLRDKVLEEVTRLYFDRRRLQVEMLMGNGDLKAQLKNELRLQELTAQLDAYTGGRFTAALGAQTSR
ncbi:MAG: hypothetical protein RLZZ299_34 [Pseudomonadota bacterium]|jgi:hypothetical protein